MSLTPSSSSSRTKLNRKLTLHSMVNSNAYFAYFNKIRGIPTDRQGRYIVRSVGLSSQGAVWSTLIVIADYYFKLPQSN